MRRLALVLVVCAAAGAGAGAVEADPPASNTFEIDAVCGGQPITLYGILNDRGPVAFTSSTSLALSKAITVTDPATGEIVFQSGPNNGFTKNGLQTTTCTFPVRGFIVEVTALFTPAR